MNFPDGQIIADNDHYRFVLSGSQRVLGFSWKPIDGLSVEHFKQGIAAYAALCKAHKPTYAVIDATALDQASPAVAWLRGRTVEAGKEDYATWWKREIVPLYHDAGIVSLAVGTGDPSAPGELADIPEGVNFRIGYFPNLDAALSWRVR